VLVGLSVAQTAFGVGGQVFAWGRNVEGQCNVPAGLNDAVAVACGRFFSMALRSDGTIVTWGYDPACLALTARRYYRARYQ
jgi:alpha-tubulin suppressor-like RCC1 family protein